VWQPVAFDMQVIEPTTLVWTGMSSGTDTPTITNVAGSVQLSAVRSVTGDEGLGMTTPISIAPPYTIETEFTFQIMTTTAAWYDSGCQFGMANGQTGSATWEQMSWWTAAASPVAVTYGTLPSPSLRSANFNSVMFQPAVRAKLVDDGTNRTFFYNTGSGYMQLYQESDSTGITNPGYWGLWCQVYNAGDQFQLTLYHASVHH
jgi:hypothetical protein